MVEKRVQRRLAAILAADVVGFSRLMETDEAGTLAALKSRRRDVLDPLVAKHEGRVFKITGDGVLVEFASAVNAVQCAADLQHAMARANSDQPEDRHVVLRIGVNLGDVMIEGSDLYGDGVNIAARLEALADPGGILVSGTAFDHIKSKVRVGFDDLGAKSLMNIAEPVRTYRVTDTPAVAVAAPKPTSGKPSIAVLPFTNMSGDPGQEYFSDGVTEDIITELARYHSLIVIARNSAFQFRGAAVDMSAVRQKLGVSYIVEGSVRRFGDQLRITAQLIDALSGAHLWADRYDRVMQDVFAVQDDVARTIATTLEGRVAASGAAQVKNKPTKDWVAYDFFLKGRERDAYFDLVGADACFAHAIELDPGYVDAHAFRAIILTTRYYLDQQPETLRQAEACARMAPSIDDHLVLSHDAMAYVAMQQRKFDLAGVHSSRAVQINPNDVLAASTHALWLVRVGKAVEALEWLDAAMRREPFPASWFWHIRCIVLFHLKRYDETIAAIHNMASTYYVHHAYCASAHAHAGRPLEAAREVATILEARPDTTIARIAAVEPSADPALLDHLLDGLRKAGLSE
jgi:adenylate cyclase